MFKRSLLATAIASITFSQSLSVLAQDDSGDGREVVLEELVIKGIRASYQKSLDIKRENIQIVDAIVAEDIGKFPDNNVVEALQRVPGVQVTDRGAGEVNGVAIRGLTDVTTTINGRQIFTSSGRQVALADIPAALIRGVDIYKTRSAEQISSGMAGQIDIHTQRPFNFDGLTFVGSLKGTHQEQAEKTDPNVSALISNRWETGSGEFGALLNVSYAKTNYRDQSVTPGALMPFTTDDPHANMLPYQIIRSQYNEGDPEAGAVDPEYWGVQNWQPGLEQGLPFAAGSTMVVGGEEKEYVLARDAIFQSDFTGKRERPAVNLSFQFSPNESSEYLFEAFYNGYRNEYFNNLFFSFVDWWGSLPPDPASTITLYPGTNVVKERSIIPNVYGFNSGDLTVDKTDSYLYAFGGKWDVGDRLRLESELVIQDSEFSREFIAMRTDRVAPAISVDFNDKDGLPAFAFADNTDTADIDESDLTNPALWNVAQLYDNGNTSEGGATTLTFDGVYDADGEFFKSIGFGLRYDQRNATEAARGVEGFCGCPMTDFDEGLQHVNENFFDGEADIPSTWVVANGYYVYNNRDEFRDLYGFTQENLTLNRNFDIDETTTELFVEAMFESGNWDGEIGLRYTSVDVDMDFFSAPDVNNNIDTASDSNSYSQVLPSAVVRYRFTDDLFARFAYTQTFRQPAFNQLNAFISYQADVTNIGYGTGNGGNPNLEPVESKNLDLSLEWYFGESSSLFGTLFTRDIDGFVFESLNRTIYQGPTDDEPSPYVVTQPANTSNGELAGAELGLVMFPDNWNGFGVQLSYTKMFESSQDLPTFNDDGSVASYFNRSIFGVSDDSYSAVLAYDKGGIGARLSYVWRDHFLNNYDQPLFANPRGVYRRPETSIDFQLTYDVSDSLAFTFDATNLAEELYQSYYQYPTTHNFGNAIYSRTFALGMRFKY